MKSGWVTKKLGEVCEILDSRRIPITKNDRKPGPIPYYGATGRVDSVADYIFDERLLLLGEDGADWSAGANSAFIIEGKSWVNNHAHVLRPLDFASDCWLMYYLNATDLNEWVSGTTVPKLNQRNMCDIPIPIPPLAEQKRIVAKIDAAFEKTDKLKSNAEKNLANAKELFQSALDEAMRPKKGWVEKRLGEVYNFIDYRGKTPTKIDKGIPLVTARNIRMGYLDYSVRDFISLDEYKTRQSRGIAHKGDILFTTEAPLGFVALADLDEFSTGQRVITFQQYEGSSLQLSNEFYYYYLQAKSFQDEIRKQATGATAQGIKASRLKNIPIAVVPFTEQKQIASRLNALSEKSNQLQQNYARQVADCAEMRQAILREAFEGRLCTREKGKWHLPEDWEAQDKALDAEIAEDFYAD